MNKRILFILIYVSVYQLVCFGVIAMVILQWDKILPSSQLGMSLICAIAILGSICYWRLFFQNWENSKELARKKG